MIHFLKPKPSIEYKRNLKSMIEGAMITGFNTIVIPGGKMAFALELILTQRVIELLNNRSDLAAGGM